MTGHEGWQGETSQTVVFPSASISLDEATIDIPGIPGIPIIGVPYSSGNIGVDAWVPASYSTWAANDRVTLGISTNAPFGFETKPRIEWAGQTYARSSRVLSVNVTPMASVKLTEKFSVGAGVQVEYLQVRLKSAAGVPPFVPNAPTVELRGEDNNLGFGATLGALFKPWEGTQFGIGYRSPIEHNLKGRLVLGGTKLTSIRATVTMPETVTVSFQQALTEQWRGWGRLNGHTGRGLEPSRLLMYRASRWLICRFNTMTAIFSRWVLNTIFTSASPAGSGWPMSGRLLMSTTGHRVCRIQTGSGSVLA